MSNIQDLIVKVIEEKSPFIKTDFFSINEKKPDELLNLLFETLKSLNINEIISNEKIITMLNYFGYGVLKNKDHVFSRAFSCKYEKEVFHIIVQKQYLMDSERKLFVSIIKQKTLEKEIIKHLNFLNSFKESLDSFH